MALPILGVSMPMVPFHPYLSGIIFISY